MYFQASMVFWFLSLSKRTGQAPGALGFGGSRGASFNPFAASASTSASGPTLGSTAPFGSATTSPGSHMIHLLQFILDFQKT